MIDRGALLAWLLETTANLAGIERSRVDPRRPLNALGVDSAGLVSLTEALAERLGRPVSPVLLYEAPTLAALVDAVAGVEGARQPAARRERAFDLPVAITGLAARLPGAADPAEVWRRLRAGLDAITEVPSDRFDIDAWYGPGRPGRAVTRRAAFLGDVWSFDPEPFGVSPREARRMDPQQRLALELCWEAMEDAGVSPSAARGARVGVFFGAIWHDWAELAVDQPEALDGDRATGQAVGMIANRVSYALGLRGPSLVVDTACSSSLVAAQLAARALREDDCDLALVGGVNLILSPNNFVSLSGFGGLSPGGRSRPFDAAADGFGRGEGGAVLVLEAEHRALARGRRPRARLRAVAVNNDGPSNGLSAPNPSAQREVIADAWRRADVQFDRAAFVETHGTGTRLGDPIEADALASSRSPGAPPLWLGALKANFGHLEGAAGVSGLLGAVLAASAREIPPLAGFHAPNPLIDWAAGRVAAPRTPTPWPTPSGEPAFAGVSSFGWGGTNAHAVIEAPPPAPRVWRIAAPDRASLERRLAAAEWGGEGPHRAAVVARTEGEAREAAGNPGDARAHFGQARRRTAAFVVPPYGPQWPEMGRALLGVAPAFTETLIQLDAIATELGVLDGLIHGAPFRDLAHAQTALTLVALGLAAEIRAWGVEPVGALGPSCGEIAASALVGAIDAEEAVRVAAAYGRAQDTAPHDGAMALASLPAGFSLPDGVQEAGVNSVASRVLSGPSGAIEEAIAAIKTAGGRATRLPISVAVHTDAMSAARDALGGALGAVIGRPPRLAYWSTSEAGFRPTVDGFANNLVRPTRLIDAVDAAIHDRVDLFIELSPGPSVGFAITERAGDQAECLTALHPSDEPLALANLRAALWVRGALDEPRMAPRVVCLSASSPAALSARARDWATAMDAAGLDAIAAAGHEAPAGAFRAAIVASDAAQARAGLDRVAAGQLDDDAPRGEAGPRPQVVFVFSGQGSPWTGMAADLLDGSGVFGDAIRECDAALAAFGAPAVSALIRAGDDFADTARAQPAIVAVEIALAKHLLSIGVQPDAVIGHSVGEIAAAWCAGCLDLPTAMRLASWRGALLASASGLGGMVQVPAPAQEVEDLLEGDACVAAINADDATIVAGDQASLDALVASLELLHVRHRRVRVDVPFHGRAVAPLGPALAAKWTADGARSAPPRIPWWRTSSGAPALVQGAPNGTFWSENLRNPVRFAQAVRAIAAGEGGVFVEVSPHPILSADVAATAPRARVVPTLRRGTPGPQALARTAAAMFAFGAVDRLPIAAIGRSPWGAYHPAPHPWQRRRFGPDVPRRRPDRATVDAPAAPCWRVRWEDLPGASPVARGIGADQAGFPGGVAGDGPLAAALRSSRGRITDPWLVDEARQAIPPSALVRLVASADHPVTVVVRGAASDGALEARPEAVGALAAWRCVALEHPDRVAAVVAVAQDVDARGVAAALPAAPEDVCAWRAGRWSAPRLHPRIFGEDSHPTSVAGTWIVTGGAGSLGRAVAAWLSARGAARVVTWGRSPAPDLPEHRIVDVTDPEAVAAGLAAAGRVSGVVHAAGQLAESAADAMTDVDELAANAAKIEGARALLAALSDDVWFVAFGSGAAVWGGAGQAGYAAANAWLEAVCAARAARVGRTRCVAWGLWARSAMGDAVGARLSRLGVRPIAHDAALAALGEALRAEDADPFVVADLDVPTFRAAYEARGRRGLFRALDADVSRAAEPSGQLAGALASPDGPQRIEAFLAAQAARLLGLPEGQLPPVGRGFFEIGFDSLAVAQLVAALNQACGIQVQTAAAFEHPTIRGLAASVAKSSLVRPLEDDHAALSRALGV